MSEYSSIDALLNTKSWRYITPSNLTKKYTYWKKTNPLLLDWFLNQSFKGSKSALTLVKETGLYVSDLQIKQIYKDFGYVKPTLKDAFPSIPDTVRNQIKTVTLETPSDIVDEKLNDLLKRSINILEQYSLLVSENEMLKDKLRNCEEIQNDAEWQKRTNEPSPEIPESPEEIIKIVEEIKEVEKEQTTSFLDQIKEGKKLKPTTTTELPKGEQKNDLFETIKKRRGAIEPDEITQDDADFSYAGKECKICRSTKNLQKCGKCLSTVYCGRECQTIDFKKHLKYCQ
jgi:hypothetical protein